MVRAMNPKISIIIPIYNVEKYIKDAIESAINQTLNDIEFICVIDGSTDNSQKITEQYALIDNRFRVLYQENLGVAIARNRALKAAQGEFIYFLDPDDMIPKTCTLELLYKYAKACKTKICGGSLIKIQDGTKMNSPCAYETFSGNSKIKYKDYQYCYFYQRFIFNREFLIENNLFFPELKRYQDPPWFVKTMNIAEEFIAIQEPTYVYRVTNNTFTQDKTKILHALEGWRQTITYAYENKLWILYRFLFNNINDNYWQDILETNYKLYPEEIKTALSQLISILDIKHFENQGLTYKLNNFLVNFI